MRKKPNKSKFIEQKSTNDDYDEIDQDDAWEDSEIIDNLGSVFCNKYKCNEAPIGVDNFEQEAEFLANIYEELSWRWMTAFGRKRTFSLIEVQSGSIVPDAAFIRASVHSLITESGHVTSGLLLLLLNR